MENVLTAVIVMFLFLFAGFTFSESWIVSQGILAEAQIDMQLRNQTRINTHLGIQNAQTKDSGLTIQLDIVNDGQNRLVEFERWDIIAQYTTTEGQRYLAWVPYTETGIIGTQWALAGIYLGDELETFDPSILNPGETARIMVYLDKAIQPDTSLQVIVGSESGYHTGLVFPRNALPQLVTHVAAYIPYHGTTNLTHALLAASDTDDPSSSIQFVVETPPQQGTLSQNPFTQADLDAGLITYTHTGDGNDSFTFSISDGKDTIGSYTYHIFVSAAPMLVNNMVLSTTSGGTGAIYNTLLKVEDADDTPGELTYTVVSGPVQGQLSLGASFTQADIDAGLLTYIHTGVGADQFNFVISDGENVIGPFTYVIVVA